MTKYSLPPMRPEQVVCPNSDCDANGPIGVHSQKERRYRCKACGRTFTDTVGTVFYGLKYPTWLVLCVLTLLAYGCPVQAQVAAFSLDERTVASWQLKAGQHAKAVQEQLVCQGQLELGQVQADELCISIQGGTIWMATAISVFSRLFVWGAIAPQHDSVLVKQVAERVWAAAQPGQPLLWAGDGFAAWKRTVLRVFRDPQRTGKPGRPSLIVWADLHIVQVVKRRTKRRLKGIERRVAHGCKRCAEALVQASQVELGVFNTAYVERLNATFRTWMPALHRRSRTPARQMRQLEAAMFWVGAVYNFCRIHATLQGTPAMAAELTDHSWSIDELVRYRVVCKRE